MADEVDALGPFVDIISDELNLKQVDLVGHSDSVAREYGVAQRVQVNARALGPRLGKDVQRVIAEVKAGNWVVTDQGVEVAGFVLGQSEYELVPELARDDIAVEFLTTGGFVLLDTEVTEELEREGLARDVIRVVQQARKDQGLDVSDRIVLELTGDEEAVSAIVAHRDLIAQETLATSLDVREGTGEGTLAVGRSSAVSVALTVA